MEYALSKCADNNSGIAYGRVTRGAVAGMLAKTKIFHASYIRRAEMYGDKIAENTTGELSTVSLYADAVKLSPEFMAVMSWKIIIQPYLRNAIKKLCSVY